MSISKQTVKWLNANCHTSIKGKTVLVTGANSGVGFKTAEIAAYLGANVILVCRSLGKAAAARDALLREYPKASVRVLPLDLADLRSIDAFAETLRQQQIDVDAFVNNAGTFHHPGQTTADGFDLVIGTNYLGVCELSEKVLPYLATLPHAVVYVNTVSIIVRVAREPDYEDFYCQKHPGRFSIYGRSKLCLAKYTYALAEKYAQTNVRVLMNHPGATITPLGLNAFGKWVSCLAKFVRPLTNSPEKSALSLSYILSHEVPAGAIVGPTNGFGIWGYPKENRVPRKVKTGAEALIRFTEQELDTHKSR